MRDVETLIFHDDGTIPNSPLPVLIYRAVPELAEARSCEQLFARHGWAGAWRNGIFGYHHFHSTAHEVLGVVGGWATVALGGPGGQALDVRAGDVLVLPAGTGHRRLDADADFLVVGAYPNGMEWDVRRGDPAERGEVLANLRAVPRPEADPVQGDDGPLVALWSGRG